MFDYGFANYKNKIVLDKDVTLNDDFYVDGGKKDRLAVRPERNSYVLSGIKGECEITSKIIADKVKAPVVKDSVVGKIEIYKDGIRVDTVNVLAAESIEKCGFGDNFKKIAENWTL